MSKLQSPFVSITVKEEDFYPIKVMCYCNPHLIWVEVLQPSIDHYTPKSQKEQTNNKFLEQIGLYAIVPLQTTIDATTYSKKISPSRKWEYTNVNFVVDVIHNAAEVWFQPEFIDANNSIFGNDGHKYGHVIIRTEDGKLQDLSTLLIKNKMGFRSETIFKRELCHFRLHTKFDAPQIKQILEAIEIQYMRNNQWIKSMDSPTKKKQEEEACSLEKSLPKHDITLDTLLEEIRAHKGELFEISKGISTGCGDIPPIQNRKRGVVKKRNLDLENNEPSIDLLEPGKSSAEKYDQSNFEDNAEDRDTKHAFENTPNKGKKKESKKMFIPDYDPKTEKLVAYGPPGVPYSQLVPKVVKKNPNNPDDDNIRLNMSELKNYVSQIENSLTGLVFKGDVSEVKFSTEVTTKSGDVLSSDNLLFLRNA